MKKINVLVYEYAETGNKYRIEKNDCLLNVYKNGVCVGTIGFSGIANYFIDANKKEVKT